MAIATPATGSTTPRMICPLWLSPAPASLLTPLLVEGSGDEAVGKAEDADVGVVAVLEEGDAF